MGCKKAPERKKRRKRTYYRKYECCSSAFKKQKNHFLIFHRIVPFLAISKLRLSTYLCTPSGIPKLRFGSVCWFQSFFPIPLKKLRLFKKPIDFLNSLKILLNYFFVAVLHKTPATFEEYESEDASARGCNVLPSATTYAFSCVK